MIPVTKSFLPDQKVFNKIISRAWDKGWLTNRGELVEELEKKLKAYLNLKRLIATTNGTLPLQIAVKSLGLQGEIITTPFSYVATTSSIVWEGCKPVFVDIHPKYLTIDEKLVEEAITPDTSGILVTHVYGNPCNVEVLENIAKKYGLKIIYDAAHCFGVKYKGRSIFRYGDISTCSFHATKLFHTGEGGALICNTEEMHLRAYYHHNFGHKGQEDFQGLGINAKMSELQAAMGLAVFHNLDKIMEERKQIGELYRETLKSHEISFLKIRSGTEWNYSYFPVIFENEQVLYKVKKTLENEKIFTRRYFYPSLNTLPYVDKKICPVADSISKKILCLPIYIGLDKQDVNKISAIINKVLC